MTQLGELLFESDVDGKVLECPFSHKKCDCPAEEVENDLDGDSDVLGNNLEMSGDRGSTVLRKSQQRDYSQPSQHETYPVVPVRVKNYGNAVWNNWVQLIPGEARSWYPVGFGAHHLIPASGSLNHKECVNFRRFMQKGKICCCNLGYDINGAENGLWLPGSYLVAKAPGKTGKAKVVDGPGKESRKNLWGAVARRPFRDKEEHVFRGSADESGGNEFLLLKGCLPSETATHEELFGEQNLKRKYVEAACELTKKLESGAKKWKVRRQFHDSHVTYYTKIRNRLVAVGVLLQNISGRTKLSATCAKCKKLGKEGRLHSPPSLLSFLNRGSDQMRVELLGEKHKPIFFTSEWGNPKYAKQRRR